MLIWYIVYDPLVACVFMATVKLGSERLYRFRERKALRIIHHSGGRPAIGLGTAEKYKILSSFIVSLKCMVTELKEIFVIEDGPQVSGI